MASLLCYVTTLVTELTSSQWMWLY